MISGFCFAQGYSLVENIQYTLINYVSSSEFIFKEKVSNVLLKDIPKHKEKVGWQTSFLPSSNVFYDNLITILCKDIRGQISWLKKVLKFFPSYGENRKKMSSESKFFALIELLKK